jgi:hypothetical protein
MTDMRTPEKHMESIEKGKGVTSTLQYQSIGPERRVLNYIKER